jgi:uncharacterized damage-inducible protein DinB
MIRKLEDFYAVWNYESESTLKMFEAISADRFKNTGSENIRSIARLAWHIAESIAEMLNHAGLPLNGISDASNETNDLLKLISEYKKSSASLIEKLKANWSDDILDEKVNMYGDMWEKGQVLSVLIRHQSHHRGQLSILLRQEGIVIPGMYGPTKEEWIAMGLAPML